MNANNIILPMPGILSHKANEEDFVSIVKDTVGFKGTANSDKIAYEAGARMMFQKLSEYAQLRIGMAEDQIENIRHHSREHESNLNTIANILKQYGDN